jgi:hypothetical protein
MKNDFDIYSLPEYLDFDNEYLENSRKRQCRLWRGEKLDEPLLFIGGSLSPKQEQIPEYNMDEMFWSKEKMLCREVRQACATYNGLSDSVPSIRANLGTGILLACFGLEQQTFPDKMPWLKGHLTKEQVSRLNPDDIKACGSFARGLEMMSFFKEVMGDSLSCYVMDTQGPFDLAHLLIGDELFLQLYDDPPFVHHLMNLCLQLGIKTHRWMKEIIGEPLNKLHHCNSLYSDSFGIRICEDTTVLLSPDQIEEFALTYSRKLAQEFGGAWVHYCGYNEYLTDSILKTPEFKVLNFGHIPGHEHKTDFYSNMEKFKKAGKVNFNDWPRFESESPEEYLSRLHKFAAEGVLAPIFWPWTEVRNSGLSTASDILTLWKEL